MKLGIKNGRIAHINRIDILNVQLMHIAQLASTFMSASSPLNIVGMFRSVGIMLWPAPDETLFCRVSSERARCLIIGFSPHEETVAIEDEIEQFETELYFEHCADTVAEEISSETEYISPDIGHDLSQRISF
jgi:hypothetical protein